jgi:hypothetical protein
MALSEKAELYKQAGALLVMAKNHRAAERREVKFYQRESRSQCVVCGRWFTRRPGYVCSRNCEEKLKPESVRPCDPDANQNV